MLIEIAMNKFVCIATCSLVMSLCSHDIITITLNGSRLTDLTCIIAASAWFLDGRTSTCFCSVSALVYYHLTN